MKRLKRLAFLQTRLGWAITWSVATLTLQGLDAIIERINPSHDQAQEGFFLDHAYWAGFAGEPDMPARKPLS